MPGAEEAPDPKSVNRPVPPTRRARPPRTAPPPRTRSTGSHRVDLPRGGEQRARLVIASNRLPVTLQAAGDGGWNARAASGGLVTALGAVMDRRGGVWVGWPGTPGVGQRELSEGLTRMGGRVPYDLRPVQVDAEECEGFYHGFSNRTLWPLLHGFRDHCEQAPGEWDHYRRVNRRFATTLADTVRDDDLVWVHDYHLLLVGRELRALGVENRVGFFLHTPFPRPDVLASLPQAPVLVRALEHFDLVGFQTPRDENNFKAAVEHFQGRDRIRRMPVSDLSRPSRARKERAPGMDGPAPMKAHARAERRARSGAFPTSIDYWEFAEMAEHPDVRERAREIREGLGDRMLLLGVDRLDYTKGIPERLRGLDLALEEFPELRGQVVLKQLVIPSREAVRSYQEQKEAIETLVARVNEEWGLPPWAPVQYRYGSWERVELLAHYRAADAAVVTPVNDGMNLVAKEYCAANPGGGVLILSAFAGAAGELGSGALLVDPSDPRGIATAIRTARRMPGQERFERMKTLKTVIRENPVQHWVQSFLERTVEGAAVGTT